MPGIDVPTLKIGFGPVQLDDNDGLYENIQNDTSAVWSDYTIINRYESDKRVYMLGLTSPNGFQRTLPTSPGNQTSQVSSDTTAFVQLASPTLLWICDWTVARVKLQPKVPDPEPWDPSWVLLDEWYETVSMTLLPDGVTPLYRISGTFFYGHKNPSREVIQQMCFPRPPWMKDSLSRKIPEDMFMEGLSEIKEKPKNPPPPGPAIF